MPGSVTLVGLTPDEVAASDLVVVLTDHDDLDWALLERNADKVLDTRNRLTDPAVDRPADIAGQVAGLPAVGAGALLYPDTFPKAHEPEHVSAAALALAEKNVRRAGAAEVRTIEADVLRDLANLVLARRS